uniref:AraC family transcriptional regulator n=1 Tax=Roseihalotalea indica TaxID=2867963 RepID=A0AA49JC73_9BACT|nr:AraC family transcriptional regulator [Tunicatimonas sp. TK19036]
MKILPFKIPQSGDGAILLQTDNQPYFYDALHQHPEIQISCILQSSGTLFLGDYIDNFTPGDVFVIGSNIPHVFKNDPIYYAENSEVNAYMLTVFLSPTALGKEFLKLPESAGLAEFIRMSKQGIKVHGTAREILVEMLTEIQSQDGLDRMITFLNIIRIIINAEESQTLSSHMIDFDVNEREGHRLNAVIRFTLNEYHRPITLEEVAEITNLSAPAFCRFFKKRTRKSYVSFLNELRIGKACKLLLDKDLSISEICYNAGFKNISHFNRKFRAILGVTPSEYRKSHLI